MLHDFSASAVRHTIAHMFGWLVLTVTNGQGHHVGTNL